MSPHSHTPHRWPRPCLLELDLREGTGSDIPTVLRSRSSPPATSGSRPQAPTGSRLGAAGRAEAQQAAGRGRAQRVGGWACRERAPLTPPSLLLYPFTASLSSPPPPPPDRSRRWLRLWDPVVFLLPRLERERSMLWRPAPWPSTPRSVPAGTLACPRPPTLGLFNLGKPAGQEPGGGLTLGSREAWGRRSLLGSLVPQTE